MWSYYRGKEASNHVMPVYFSNFKSYKNETTLDYQAAVLPEFKNTLITETSASDLLPVNVVYGPNGGGKSNLLQALACCHLYDRKTGE